MNFMNRKPLQHGFTTALALVVASITSWHAQAAPVMPDSIVELVNRCAPSVHPNTMLKLLKHESGFQPFIIGVNATPRQVFNLKNADEAAAKARELIAAGKNIDMGLGQINSANLARLKLTPEQVFDPCTNVQASAQILAQAYRQTSEAQGGQRAALDQALSIYNTGNTARGIANGYVGKVRSAQYVVPALDAEAAAPQAPQLREEGPPPSWDVFAQARYRGPREAPQAQEATPAADPAAPVMLFRDDDR